MKLMKKTCHFEKSKQLAEFIGAEVKKCFWNAAVSLTYYNNAEYVYGLVSGPHGLHMLHGWVEYKDYIIDPTIVLIDGEEELKERIYYPIKSYDRAGLLDYLKKNKNCPPPGVNIFGQTYQEITEVAENYGIDKLTLIC